MQARWFRHLLNLYPPFVGAGIRVQHIAPDWRRIEVRMSLRWYNRNSRRVSPVGAVAPRGRSSRPGAGA